ncbi:unnamed protein product [Dicrocoelium dendriticum]|nr:unnamed protein product [Dicrocoelium dendriticum]
MFLGSNQPKSRIAEANRHISELCKRVSELEEQLTHKEAELKEKEENFAIAMQEIGEKRRLELKELNALIYQQNLKLQHYEKDMSARDSELTVLRKRCRMFDEVLRYKATLGKLTITLEQAEQYASLTSNARGYARGYQADPECVHTDPAPLMIRDVPTNSMWDVTELNGVAPPINGVSEPNLLALSTNQLLPSGKG